MRLHTQGRQQQRSISPLPLAAEDPFAQSQPDNRQRGNGASSKQRPDASNDAPASAPSEDEVALGDWLHVCLVPAAEHAACMEDATQGWAGAAKEGLCMLELPPLGAETAQAPAVIQDADADADADGAAPTCTGS